MILRRLYLYVVSAAALIVLAVGLAALGGTIVLFLFNDPSADYSRTQLAIFAAMSIVAFPVWGVHFLVAQRFAARDPYERASAIRRLYVYFACLVFSLATLVALSNTLAQLLRPLLDADSLNGESAAQVGWATVVFAAIWAFHFYVATRDRAVVREEGASATLRRWYMYVALLVGLLTMLAFTQQVLELAWSSLNSARTAPRMVFEAQAGAALAGAAVWALHARVIAVKHIADDRHSTLRAVEGFIAVAVSIATALYGASQVLYYALARALGVSNPGGASNDALMAAASPVSLLLVYGIAWYLINRRLVRDAAAQEAERQAAVRRLYTNLVALIALAAWAYGAAMLLGTIFTLVEAPVIGVAAPDWKDPVSVSATLLVVGAAVWLAYWRQAPWAADRQSLGRRLYVWTALLGSVLAVLGGGVGLVYVVLQQSFSTHPKLGDPANLGFASSLATILVAAAVGAYHLQVLRGDAASRVARHAEAPVPAPRVLVTTPPSPQKMAPEAEALDENSHRYTLVVTDATEDDVHQALSSLPPQAGYRLIPSEEADDGH